MASRSLTTTNSAAVNVWLLGGASAIALVAGTISLALVWKSFSSSSSSSSPEQRSNNRDNDNDQNNDDNDDDDYYYALLPEHLQRQLDKEKRRLAKIPLLAMKKPMYDNIRMLDPQGNLLCTISQKKANWYIRKQLATWRKDDYDECDPTKEPATKTKTIQLLFKPRHQQQQQKQKQSANRSSDDNDIRVKQEDDQDADFNKSVKENICVVCGDDQYHMRHYIVPYSCRCLFPSQYKEHMAHDVLILCPDCHLDCKKLATNRLQWLDRQCRAQLQLKKDTATPQFVNRPLYKVKSCALALLKQRDKLPATAIADYEALVQTHFGCQELSMATLQAATELETIIPNPNYIPTASVVVACLCQSDAAIEAFVKDWRRHFVETMQPQHLPKGWNVDSSVMCRR